jgi:hypothetical protein
MRRFAVLVAVAIGASAPASALAKPHELKAAIKKWAHSVKHGSADDVASHYDKDAHLWGTFATKSNRTPKQIRGYFAHLKDGKDVSVKLGASQARTLAGGVGVVNGTYKFVVREPGGAAKHVPARYSFTLKKGARGAWKIVDHHSSVIPTAR